MARLAPGTVAAVGRMSTLPAGTPTHPQPPEYGALLDELQGAGIQFITVVGDPPGNPLRLIVSRHPANLRMLGATLDRLGAQVRTGAAGWPPPGTIPVATRFGDLELLVGGTGSSLYSDAIEAAGGPSANGEVVNWREVLGSAGAVEHRWSASVRRHRRRSGHVS
jgi:hypothetical protein